MDMENITLKNSIEDKERKKRGGGDKLARG